VNTAFQIREKFKSFAKGAPLADSYLDSPLISNALTAVSTEDVNKMRGILADSVLHSPIIAKFQSVWEMTDILAEFPFLVSTIHAEFMQKNL